MHQNASGTDIISMEPLNFKVEYRNRFFQLFISNGINKCIFAVSEFQLIIRLQILCGDPALALHIEGMLGGTGNGFAADLNMNQFILFFQERADYAL